MTTQGELRSAFREIRADLRFIKWATAINLVLAFVALVQVFAQ